MQKKKECIRLDIGRTKVNKKVCIICEDPRNPKLNIGNGYYACVYLHKYFDWKAVHVEAILKMETQNRN